MSISHQRRQGDGTVDGQQLQKLNTIDVKLSEISTKMDNLNKSDLYKMARELYPDIPLQLVTKTWQVVGNPNGTTVFNGVYFGEFNFSLSNIFLANGDNGDLRSRGFLSHLGVTVAQVSSFTHGDDVLNVPSVSGRHVGHADSMTVTKWDGDNPNQEMTVSFIGYKIPPPQQIMITAKGAIFGYTQASYFMRNGETTNFVASPSYRANAVAGITQVFCPYGFALERRTLFGENLISSFVSVSPGATAGFDFKQIFDQGHFLVLKRRFSTVIFFNDNASSPTLDVVYTDQAGQTSVIQIPYGQKVVKTYHFDDPNYNASLMASVPNSVGCEVSHDGSFVSKMNPEFINNTRQQGFIPSGYTGVSDIQLRYYPEPETP